MLSVSFVSVNGISLLNNASNSPFNHEKTTHPWDFGNFQFLAFALSKDHRRLVATQTSDPRDPRDKTCNNNSML